MLETKQTCYKLLYKEHGGDQTYYKYFNANSDSLAIGFGFTWAKENNPASYKVLRVITTEKAICHGGGKWND